MSPLLRSMVEVYRVSAKYIDVEGEFETKQHMLSKRRYMRLQEIFITRMDDMESCKGRFIVLFLVYIPCILEDLLPTKLVGTIAVDPETQIIEPEWIRHNERIWLSWYEFESEAFTLSWWEQERLF